MATASEPKNVPRQIVATIESLRGAAGTLPRPLPWREVLEIAREDALLGKYHT